MNTDNCDPTDAEVNAYLDLQDRPGKMDYEWIDAKVESTPYIQITKTIIDVTRIVVGDPLEWPYLLVRT